MIALLLMACSGSADDSALCLPDTGARVCDSAAQEEPSTWVGSLAPGDLNEWIGDWVGHCSVSGFGQDLETSLVIAEHPDGLEWNLSYPNEPTRAYTMRRTDDPAQWVLDENNGITIDHTLAADQLVGLFSISDQLIAFNWTRTGDRMDVLMPFFDAEPTVSSSGSDEVESFKGRGVQRCILRR